MFITNVDEAVPILRTKFREYLAQKLNISADAKKIKCFIHEDSTPSMYFNPKNNYETATCFGCNRTVDIFEAAAILDNVPASGPEWITETIPYLSATLNVPLRMGQPSALDKEKAELYRLAQDIADILASSSENENYLKKRNWITNDLIIGSISEEELLSRLIKKGYSHEYLITSGMIRTEKTSFFGENKVTFVIKDYRNKPVAFVSRNLEEGAKPKYINSAETLIYEKRKTLVGLDIALKKGKAKQQGLYVVEGPGDLTQLYRLGIYNAVACCGTALTKEHLELIKMLGISKLNLSFDWDNAGAIATNDVLKKSLSGITGLACSVIINTDTNVKDIDELLSKETNLDLFNGLKRITAFEWMMQNVSSHSDATEICAELIPTIAAEPTAIQREKLAKILSQYTSISLTSIFADIETLRNGKAEERKERILAAGQKYLRSVESDPENISSLIAQHEDDIASIDKEYDKHTIGVNYQLSRFDALQSKREREATDGSVTEFRMTRFLGFKNAFANGADATSGVLIYLGGRPNSGKTATGIAVATDVLVSDPDAIVIGHFTDDNYTQVEPRFKSNISEMIRSKNDPRLTIGQVVNPILRCTSQSELATYNRANDYIREALADERLILIDQEDGSIMSSLEKQLKYIRYRYPSKKIFLLSDNTHRYKDYPNKDPMTRMRMISDRQKELTTKYDCALFATVEYRKNMPFDQSKIKFPVDDDIADARALMYNPNAIIHVYNDMHDRKDDAEIFWIKNGLKQPRLTLLFSKNKIADFKDKLIFDLDTSTVTLKETPVNVAAAQFEQYNGDDEVENTNTIYIDTDYEE